MRDYSRVSGKFWTSKTGKDIKKRGQEAVIMAMYLMTAPQSNMLGLYYLAIPTAGHESGLGSEGASRGLQFCIEAGFCDYDIETEMVWVFEMAKYQVGGALKASDLQVKGVQKQYNELAENPFLARFYDRYGQDFKMVLRRGEVAPDADALEGALNPNAGQEQEQASAQRQDQVPAQSGLRPASAKSRAPANKPNGEQRSPSSLVWDFYAAAYGTRYGHEPTRNAKVNAQLSSFIKRVPAEEAPSIAAFFVKMNSAFYVRKCHAVDCLLADAEAIRTQWLNGSVVTSTHATHADRAQTNDNVFGRLLAQSEAVHGAIRMDDDDVLDVEAKVVP